jgi:hypothetical protein
MSRLSFNGLISEQIQRPITLKPIKLITKKMKFNK